MELIVVSADITLCSAVCSITAADTGLLLIGWAFKMDTMKYLPKKTKIEDCYTVDSSNNSHRHQWTALFELPYNLCVYRLS